MKKCTRIVGYEMDDLYTESNRSIPCGKDASVKVLGFIESPFMKNYWQVEPYFVCESHAEESLNRSNKRRQEIIDSGGKFVRVDIPDIGNGNTITHVPIDLNEV